MAAQPSLLPQQIPPQDSRFTWTDQQGTTHVDINWWLFFYNLALQTISQSGGSVPLSPTDFLPFSDIDAFSTDYADLPRRIVNVQELIPELDASPTFRDLANANLIGLEPLLQDPRSVAQPIQSVTVGASPFTYTAPFAGAVSLAGGTVTIVNLIRQGTSIVTGFSGSLAAVVPVAQGDQVKVTYTAAPTINFLPS